ncbi:ParB/RepB/Spo0J family partition protein [Streptomyces fructofermentans]|uniref:ParB/RepB/Spo0J family partition protein n=1 Tax=Streptomyces fructofermentans TaxID=152141 RepID=UPI0033C7DA7B
MSKADQLGAGRFGGGVRPVSARRQAVAAATGVPTDGVAPPSHLPPARISPNPDNPRSSLGDLTQLAGSLKTHGQKQAITVMNRDAYLRANPGCEDHLEPDTTHVVIDGSSRLAAAREAGLESVAVMVSDDQGSNSEELLESALIANIMRNDLSEIDEARALQRLLSVYGSQRSLAKQLHRSQGWVSQRLALLNLAPELQARIGDEPIELLRAVGSTPAEGQESALQELKAQRAATESSKAAQKRSPVVEPTAVAETPTPVEGDGGDYDVITDSTSTTTTTEPEQSEVRSRIDTVPDPRGDSELSTSTAAGEGGPRKLPYNDGSFLALHLIRKMSDTEFDKMLSILNDHRTQRDTSAESAAQ